MNPFQLIKSFVYTGELNQDGQLCNYYAPLHNLISEETRLLSDFTTKSLNFDLEHPVDIQIQPAYDGAVNLILNDGKNIPRLINSRFSVLGENQFRVTDHTGFKDTNIYEEINFDIDTAIKPISVSIPQVNYLGLLDNAGSVKCGSYTFYFKLSDADYNETEVLAESGIIQCHIGKTNDPSSIRMGMEDELTDKAIKLEITDIDLGFDYVFVYYSRCSSGNSGAITPSFYKIVTPYPVSYNGTCLITINGLEDSLQIAANEIETDYADISAANAVTISKNTLLLGNTNSSYHDWNELQKMSWKIHTEVGISDDLAVGSLDYQYHDPLSSGSNQFCYYNTLNTYYRLGYWSDELYRIGIVYIFNDNSLSPVFNLQGRDLGSSVGDTSQLYSYLFKTSTLGQNTIYQERQYEPEDYFFDKSSYLNSKGVFYIPYRKNYSLQKGILIPKPLYLKFSLRDIGVKEYINNSPDNNKSFWKDALQKHNIKGFFFVRQKRLPNILCQGVMIGKTAKDFGNVPVLMNSSQSQYYFQSFLQNDTEGNGQRILIPKSKTQSQAQGQTSNENVCTYNALLIPDAELQTAMFNTLFCSTEYNVSLFNQLVFDGEKRIIQDNYDPAMSDKDLPSRSSIVAKLTNIPEFIKLQTDGVSYFSSMIGNASDVTSVIDIKQNWNKTAPATLTASRSLVRGLWGSYVGVTAKEGRGDTIQPFTYGNVYNVKKTESLDNLFYNYFKNNALYYAISDRTSIYKLDTNATIKCYRGDCFITLFTHRLFRNFIDPELPTNTQIVDPVCWAKNFKVRNTCTPKIENKSNLVQSDGGFWDKGADEYVNQVVPAWERCMYFTVKSITTPGMQVTGNIDASATDGVVDVKIDNNTTVLKTKFHSEGATRDHIARTDSQEISSAGAVIKTFLSPTSKEWELRGTNQINRADVNAVGLGQWVIFPICSAMNLSMRDVDFNNATEEAQFNRKRSFYPLSSMDQQNPLQDSNVINTATKVSISQKGYYGYQSVPYNKQEYHTRINYSQIDNAKTFTNGFKQLLEDAYVDYPKTLGEITKLVALGDYVYVICKHGIGVIEVRLDAKEGEQHLTNMQVISDMYGTMWKDSVVTTDHFIYGVDTIAKKIWQIVGNKVNLISDQRVENFLIDNIDLSEFNMHPFIGHINVKSHYNAFKGDVMFTYYNDIPVDENGKSLVNKYNIETNNWDDIAPLIKEWKAGKIWSLCWNERLQSFQTFYDWTPIASENIDNIYFSFDKERADDIISNITASQRIAVQPKNSKGVSYVSAKINKHQLDPIFNGQVDILHYTCLNNQINQSFQLLSAITIQCPTKYVWFTYIYNPTGYKLTVKYDEQEKVISQIGWSLIYFYNNTNSEVSSSLVINCTKQDVGTIKKSFIKIYPYITRQPVELIQKETATLYCDQYPYTNTTVNFRTPSNSLLLWKHGQAGIYDCQGDILPTNWYGKQHEFNFEFVVKDNQPVQKIYNNLKIISNKTQPNKFEYEIVGEGYDWWPYKPVIQWINEKSESDPRTDKDYWWKTVLQNPLPKLRELYPEFPEFKYGTTTQLKKLPYLKIELTDRKGRKDRSYHKDSDAWSGLVDRKVLNPNKQSNDYAFNCNETVIKYDEQLNEYRIHDEQLGNDMSKFGRIRGNMQYLEDFWNVEIRPIQFKWYYLEEQPLNWPQIKVTDVTITSDKNSNILMIRSKAKGGEIVLDLTGWNNQLNPIIYARVESGEVGAEIKLNGTSIYKHKNNNDRITINLIPGEDNQIEFTGYLKLVCLESETQPIKFVNSGFRFKKVETRHRDKYIKVKVRYSGEDITVIQAIQSMFDYSYA